MSNFFVEGRPESPMAELPIADKDHGSPGYLPLIGLRLEAGRWFTDSDLSVTEKGPNGVAIVNRAFVRQFFPNEDPIGRRLLSESKKQASQIVGVVSDYRPMGDPCWLPPNAPPAPGCTRTLLSRAAAVTCLISPFWTVPELDEFER